MSNTGLYTEIRKLGDQASVIDVKGEVTAGSEDVLSSAFTEASGGATRAVVFNFTNLDYMNSGGIGLLVTLLVRAKRQKQKLMAVGLNEHYRQIFELTRLDEAIEIHPNEESAASAAVK